MSFLAERVLAERPKFFLLGINAPAAEDDAQRGHHWNREIYAQDSGDFSSSHDSKNRGQRMQFHAVAHDARGGT